MTKKIVVEPIMGESIRSWVNRFEQNSQVAPKKKNLLKYSNIFTQVSIKDDIDANGLALSAKIQKALMLLHSIFPTEQEYYWDGTMVFWFNSISDAITFKLHLANE